MLREEYSHGARGPVWLCIMRCTSRYMCLVSMPRTRIALQKVGLRLGGSFLSAMPSCQPWWHGECPLTAPYARAATIWINVLEPRLDNDDGTGWFARSSIHQSISYDPPWNLRLSMSWERQRRQITCVGLRGMVLAGHSWSGRINSIKSISGRGDDAGAVYIPDGPDLRYQQST